MGPYDLKYGSGDQAGMKRRPRSGGSLVWGRCEHSNTREERLLTFCNKQAHVIHQAVCDRAYVEIGPAEESVVATGYKNA
jgi:hypothetical protein